MQPFDSFFLWFQPEKNHRGVVQVMFFGPCLFRLSAKDSMLTRLLAESFGGSSKTCGAESGQHVKLLFQSDSFKRC